MFPSNKVVVVFVLVKNAFNLLVFVGETVGVAN